MQLGLNVDKKVCTCCKERSFEFEETDQEWNSSNGSSVK